MKRIFASILLLGSIALLSSCNIAAVAAYVASPDPEQEALFTLPNVPTVVFVDDRANAMHPVRLRRVIAEEITNELLNREVLTTMISPRDILRVSAANDRYNAPLPINELGKSVDASTVIYVEMVAFGLTSDGQTASPRTTCNIRVIDVKNRKRLFPTDPAGYAVSEHMTHVTANRVTSSSDAKKLAEELAVKLGYSIAEIFYDHVIGRLGDNLERK
tara:strand:- start:335 stop:985 length:651 start_codon:yes stop_codon:yes gene_type:complete